MTGLGRFLLSYGDDVGYWLGIACGLVLAWIAFVGLIHLLTHGNDR